MLRWLTAFLTIPWALTAPLWSTKAHAAPPVSLNSGWQLQDQAKVAETGERLSRVDYRPSNWYAAVVPGTLLTSLVADGVYPEPLYGENNRPDKIPESLCRTPYWYRKTFLTPTAFRGRRVWLNFAGINYTAEVWLNGRDLGTISGAFARGLFDVTDVVAAGRQPNALAVEILPPPHPGSPKEQMLGNGYGPNGGDLEDDTPTFVAAVGWDWTPAIRDRDLGIWQDVTLTSSGPVTLNDPYVTTTLPLPRTDSADLNLEVTLRNATDKPASGTLIGTVEGREFRQAVTLDGRASRTIHLSPSDAPSLHLTHPRLWWPNGYGVPNLYTMPLRFVTADGKGVSAVSDARDITFGVHTITYETPRNPGKFTLVVNGLPILARGGNWGMDEAMKRSPHARLEAQIRLHRDVGFSMIRNWVGQTTQEDFYDLCDRYGILVWDDYWLDDTTRPIPAAMFLANAREKLLRFRNHPCIALYCERNEFWVDPPFAKPLRALTHELDPLRWYQPISSDGNGVGGHGSYGVEPVEYYFKPYQDSFHTEIGAPSIPTLEALHAMMPARDWPNYNDDWAEHDMCQNAYPFALTARYGPIVDTNDFVRKAQLSGYEGYRAMFEGRNARMFDPASGVLIWMSNPAQPSLVWQIYSYDLEPNSTYFGVKHACETIHVQMTPDGQVQVINNAANALPGLTATATVYDMDGTRAFSQSTPVAAAGASATNAFAIDWAQAKTPLSPVHFVRLTLHDARGVEISRNFYWHTTPAAGQDCSALQTLPTVALDVRGVRQADPAPGRTRLLVTLRNPTNAVALMAHLQLRQQRFGTRVLPVAYSDNYISLLPGETQTITVEAATLDFARDAPLLTVDGWNVTKTLRTFGTIAIAPNPAVGVAHIAPIRAIRCGAGWLDGYAADCDVTGGGYVLNDNKIDTAGVADAAPTLLYRSERYGDCTYTIPMTAKDSGAGTYSVHLHFAETGFDKVGARRFNVEINGRRVLEDFDILLAAGGKNRAVVRTFGGITPDASGNVVIHFARGAADQPKVCGIQILPGS